MSWINVKIIFRLNQPRISINSMPIQKCIHEVFYNFFSIHKICPIFVELQVFIFHNMIRYNLFINFVMLLKW